MEECIFCNIAQKKASADIVAEDDQCVAFRDIHPEAPVHLLVIPRTHVSSLDELNEEDGTLAGKLLLCAQKVAKRAGLKGYKIRINVGREGGQVVDHLHLHVLGDTANQ